MACIDQAAELPNDPPALIAAPPVAKTTLVESHPVGPGFPGSAFDDDEPRFDPGVILHSIRRRWRVGLSLGLLIAPVVVAAMWFVLRPQHAAVAYLRIDSVDTPLAFQTADQIGGGRGAFDLYKNTQSQLIKTPFVLNKALADDKVMGLASVESNPDVYQWIKDGLSTAFPGHGELMAIRFECDDSRTAKTVVDAIVAAYMDEAVHDETRDRKTRLSSLEAVYEETDSDARAKRAQIRKLADAYGTSDSQSLSLAQQMSVGRYGQMQSELGRVSFELMRATGEIQAYRQIVDQLQSKRKDLDAQLTQLQTLSAADQQNPEDTSSDSKLSDVEVTAVVTADPVYQRLYNEGRQLRDEIEMYKSEFGENMIRHRREQLDRLEKEVVKRRDELIQIAEAKKAGSLTATTDTAFANLPPDQRELAVQIAELDDKIKAKQDQINDREINVGVLKQQVQRMEIDLAALDAEAKKLGQSSVDVEMMRAEIASHNEVLSRLAGEIERTKIELKNSSRVSVISEAAPVRDDSAKKRILTCGFAGISSLMLPLVALIGLDARRKLVNDSESISRDLDLPVLGSVPRERELARQFQNDAIVDGAFGNSVGSIVAILVNKAKYDDKNVIMVTSAVSGEGKSTLAYSLWRGLADARYRTVIVDFDLRRPTLHYDLGISADPGVSDILSGDTDWKTSLRKQSQHRFFLTAGSSRAFNLAAEAQDGIPKLIDELRIHFDFVVIDTPPILPLVDTRIIGEHVDAAVLAVMRDRSRTPQVIAAAETLKAHGTPIMGVVVNGCQASRSHSKYYYRQTDSQVGGQLGNQSGERHGPE